MSFLRRLCLVLFLATSFCLAANASAMAQACQTSATGAAFGNYDPTAAAPVTTTATVTVTCQAVIQLLIGYTISLSPGLSGSQTARKLMSGSDSISYQLFADSNMSQIWGDGNGGTVTKIDGYLLAILGPVVRNYTAFGRITARQNVSPGSYSDTLTVLLVY